jgi:outer membrane biosynthesis protein TonB
MALGLDAPAPARSAPPIVTEIELAPPPEPEPEPDEPLAPEPHPTTSPAEPEKMPSARAAPAPSSPVAAARAPNVLVAKDDAPAPAEPVDFVTDPSGSGYHGGIVARGGSGTGAPGARAATVGRAVRGGQGSPTAPRSDITPASDLSRRPSLQTGAGCGGFYPRQADADSAVATVRVVVSPGGGVAQLSLVNESPAGQGFGAAAGACLRSSRFTSGLDKSGRAVKSVAMVRVRFTR